MMRSVAVAAGAVVAILLSAPVAASASCVGDVGFTAVSFQNGWASTGAPNPVPGYRRDYLGDVHLEGQIGRGTVGAVAFTLPVGYRPLNGRAGFAVVNGGNYVNEGVLVYVDGTVVIQSLLGNSYAGLDGIAFYAGPDCSVGSGGSGGSGMTNPMTTAQDLIVGGASGAPGRLGVGSAGQVLTVGSGGVVGWVTAAVTSVDIGSFSGDGLATVNQFYTLILAIGALLVLGVGYTIASGLRK